MPEDGLYACRYEMMMKAWREQWHQGTGGATDPDFPIGLVQIGPHGSSATTFATRMGQTADFGFAPNSRWPHSFMATAFDLSNPPGTHCMAGCVHVPGPRVRGMRRGMRRNCFPTPETVRTVSGVGKRFLRIRTKNSTCASQK